MQPPPSTPAPRRFLLAKRNTQRGGGTQPQSQAQAQPSDQQQRTPGAAAPTHSQFQSTPRFGPSSSALRSTQRRGLDVEDVVDIDDDEHDHQGHDHNVDDDGDGGDDEAELGLLAHGGDDAGREVSPRDSIEMESDSVLSASQDDAMVDASEHADAPTEDEIIEVDSQQVETLHASPHGRQAKRRKLSISPAPESSPIRRLVEQGEPATPEQDPRTSSRAGTEDMDLPDSDADDSAHSPSERTAARDRSGRAARDRTQQQQQPIFRPAPRFKPVAEADDYAAGDEGGGLPAAFSPQRRGARYVPGGLAAELQGWLSEVKGWESHGDVRGTDSSGGSLREFVVDEVRPGRRMYLVRARPRGGDGGDAMHGETMPLQSIILAGEGKLTGLGRRAMVGVGSAVRVGGPVWDVEIEDTTWTDDAPPDMTLSILRPLAGLHRPEPVRRLAALAKAITSVHHKAHHRHPRFPFSSSACRLRQRAVSDPLRILFCGSDDFSCASLRALHAEHARDPGLVSALDVMVLPPRRTGRGFKQLREVPCKALAEELGLRVHQRETFRNWELPEGTNLVVVVSFGLFVPPRILNSAKYGGLNVHPSFLPDLRGPAPIHHALLRGDSHIGVTLQTLDDRQFDHGAVLAQTPTPGVPVRPGAPLQEVIQDAAAKGAELLVQGLRDGLHVPPHRDLAPSPPQGGPLMTLTHAPKVTKADAQIDWEAWRSGEDFARRVRVFGSVWTHAVNDGGHEKRVLFLDAEPRTAIAAEEDGVQGEAVAMEFAHDDGRGEDWATHLRRVAVDEGSGACAVSVGESVGEEAEEGDDAERRHGRRREWVVVRRVKVDGKKEQSAATGLRPFLRRPPL
ncbi:methionyl-tRNA formyltransferase [Purpureocillium lavendulum]|uniref:methionyl-tRNA formyltransferase n=1 Tax=Purpureocillium lavendulum TaxID=1247861 RepID=A0AB34FYT1_9HYPO|nr:methionyl-tRNA formyltransferase [Purpureocillium lavendulum]